MEGPVRRRALSLLIFLLSHQNFYLFGFFDEGSNRRREYMRMSGFILSFSKKPRSSHSFLVPRDRLWKDGTKRGFQEVGFRTISK
jgi:hypothetical protein